MICHTEHLFTYCVTDKIGPFNKTMSPPGAEKLGGLISPNKKKENKPPFLASDFSKTHS